MKAQISRFARALAISLAAAALAAPAAGARPAGPDPDVAAPSPAVESIDEGIDPASAALGAAGAGALALLAAVGAARYRGRRGATTEDQVDVTR